MVFIEVFVSYIFLAMQMPSLPLAYIGYTDGASCHTCHIASAVWVIYTPKSELFCSGGVFLGTTTNNIAEYMSIISLLTEASSRDISYLVVRLDSQLVVMKLANRYHIRNPTLLRHYLRVRLLECQFEVITYEHIPREFNIVVDSLENYVLDWHMSH